MSAREIRRRIEIVRDVMQTLDVNVWPSIISFATKLRLYNSLVIPVLLHGAETWTSTKCDFVRLDEFDGWCLRRIVVIRWQDHVPNTTVRDRTQ
jgi:hypothetical protein